MILFIVYMSWFGYSNLDSGQIWLLDLRLGVGFALLTLSTHWSLHIETSREHYALKIPSNFNKYQEYKNITTK